MATPANLSKFVKGPTLRYPENVGSEQDGLHHFMVINELEFVKPEKVSDKLNALNYFKDLTSSTGTEGKGVYRINRSFVLYLPQGAFKTQYAADYTPVDIGLFGNVLAQDAGQILEKAGQRFESFKSGEGGVLNDTIDFYTGLGEDLLPTGQKFVGAFEKDMVSRIRRNVTTAFGNLAKLTSPAGAKLDSSNIAALSMRQSRNPYTSLVFTGVKKLREHDFKFDFNPKNSRESHTIATIIASLKQGMLPSLPVYDLKNQISWFTEETPVEEIETPVGPQMPQPLKKDVNISNVQSAFFRFPNVYTITFYDFNGSATGNEYLHKIGQSVLESVNVKYSQTFFEDSGAPTNISLNLKFRENFAMSYDSVEEGY